MAATLESAIPENFRQERTLPAKTPPNYQPPYPSYSARWPREAKDLVMAIIGTQHEARVHGHSPEYQKIVTFVEGSPDEWKPRYWEAASVTDNRGYFNEAAICYWQTGADYEAWASQSGFEAWWQDLKATPEVGWFQELFSPSLDRFETVFSDNVVPEGAAHMRESISGEIQEHTYWGSMRDRLPASQTDHLVGAKPASELASNSNARSRRIKVPARENLAVIRSGQDWSNTNPHERKLYLDTMHPVLIKGMEFLRDQGDEVGCFDCRFMDVVDKISPEKTTDKTFGLAYFDDLKSLEGWSKDHKTHLDIFGRFLQHAAELQNNVSLRLFHEVLVLKPEQQYFEYVGCHSGTGMLASL